MGFTEQAQQFLGDVHLWRSDRAERPARLRFNYKAALYEIEQAVAAVNGALNSEGQQSPLLVVEGKVSQDPTTGERWRTVTVVRRDSSQVAAFFATNITLYCGTQDQPRYSQPRYENEELSLRLYGQYKEMLVREHNQLGKNLDYKVK